MDHRPSGHAATPGRFAGRTDLCNFPRMRLIWVARGRELWIEMPIPEGASPPATLTQVIGPRAAAMLDRLDRRHHRAGPLRGTRLDLEVADVTRKLIVMRAVRRGWESGSDRAKDLAEFCFTLSRRARCEICAIDRTDVYDPCRWRPVLDPADQRLLRQPITPGMLHRLAARSSNVLMEADGHIHEFGGLSHNGRLTRCGGKGGARQTEAA